MPKPDGFLEEGLDYLSREARYYVLDALHCVLFNTANTLDGNTEQGDMGWFAERLHSEMRPFGVTRFEELDEDTRAYYFHLARATIQCLPQLLARIEHRCRVQAAVVGEMAKAERLALDRSGRKRRPTKHEAGVK
jgi:hypothetical protein